MVVREMHRPSSFAVPAHQKGGMAPIMPQRHTSIVAAPISEDFSTWELPEEEAPPMAPPPPPRRAPGGETPKMPGRRRTVNLENEKHLLAVASASAEF